MLVEIILQSHADRREVIVKHLPAMQNFRTIDVFCSDETGTLMTGEMVLDSSVDSWVTHPIVL